MSFHSNTSQSTIKQKEKPFELADPSSKHRKKRNPSKPETVKEEDVFISSRSVSRDVSPIRPSPSPIQPAPPSSFPTRTPARTKRRSVSSNLSQPSSPVSDAHLTLLPPQDFSQLLNSPAPLLFSTPLERSLLNNLSALGFDIGQMVHSVLSDACDASGALWWMLKRKAEKKALETAYKTAKEAALREPDTELETEIENQPTPSPCYTDSPAFDQVLQTIDQSRSAPELTFVPPTPTVPVSQKKKKEASPPVTPPRSKSPRSFLSPTPTSMESMKSTPSTPSAKDKEPKDGSKGRSSAKPRSGSVSIVQRATTAALEATGLMRKRSNEAVKEKDKDKDKERDKDKDKEKDKEKDHERGSSSSERNGSNSAKLTKSPPLKPMRDKDVPPLPVTPEKEVMAATDLSSASPWVMPLARSSTFSVAPTPLHSPDNGNSFGHNSQKMPGSMRSRTSILHTFRMWFNEDRKGKRKASTSAPNISSSTPVPPSPARARGSFRRQGGWNSSKPRAKRASVSSRRSSSVNSRRSSVTSMQMMLMETPVHGVDHIQRQRSDPSRRSFTPNSEMDREVHSSRPSSIRSYSRNRHRKSPSGGSTGSTARLGRASSPLKQYHRRAGSNTSTRVMRHTRHSHSQNINPHTTHVRSNSTASSIHSRQSSRPGSFYDASETEGGSPLSHLQRYLDETPRRGSYNTVHLAHKKQSALVGPSTSFTTSVNRHSWKKAWGTEPPGWQSRPSQFPVEVLSISPVPDQLVTIRDVFSGPGRQSINLDDDSDWVDEEDDFPAFVGGLGQIPTNASTKMISESPIKLSPAPRSSGNNNNRVARKGGRGRTGRSSRAGHSPVASGNMPLPSSDGVFSDKKDGLENYSNRRQLPNGRSGPAFRTAAIVEEEEEEEEEE